MRRFLATALLSVSFPLSAQADAITVYDESVSGDLTSDWGTSPLLNLSPGHNLVLGTWNFAWSEGSGRDPDYDFFRFMAPVGYTVQLVTFTASYVFQNVYNFSINFPYVGLNEFGLPDTTVAYGTVGGIYPMVGGVVDDSQQVLHGDFGSNPFPVSSGMMGIPGGVNVTYFGTGFQIDAAYSFDLLVHRVPEPSTLALLSLSLAGLALTYRSKRN